MPQLDVITFINQYIWMIGSVTAVVIVSIISLLPSIKKLIEIRDVSSMELLDYKRNKDFITFKKLMNF
uniref:ATP synthase F0 subunit 8 n=1 Tax=Rhizostoma pulmo TaxID=269554 RepID=G9IT82_RHIPL|nr:ATP synthase F0 subunit 8 [Rhizostoma pulmo]